MVLGIALAIGLTLYALQQNISLFYTPTQIALNEAPAGQLIRVGGLVENKSVVHDQNSLKVSFVVTDNKNSIPIDYEGILPDLFREGQGIVVQGRLKGGRLQTTQVLAKHDENYMPRAVYEELRKLAL